MATKTLKSAEQPKSAQVVASIDDLLTEILLRLPVKSLIRFKLVSNQWRSLITNPKFCRLRIQNPNPVGLLYSATGGRYCHKLQYFPFSADKSSTPPPPLKRVTFPIDAKVLQSCNGLLLCTDNPNMICPSYYVYNPTTNGFLTLPAEGGEKMATRSMNLAFDPSKSPFYQVICFVGLIPLANRKVYYIHIYSSDTGVWTSSGYHFCNSVITGILKLGSGVYCHGAIHWIDAGLYFKIEHQMFEKMPVPPIAEGHVLRDHNYFGESCDHLQYALDISITRAYIDVYEMKRDYSEWFIKYRVETSQVLLPLPRLPREFWLLSVIRGEEEDKSFLVLQYDEKVIRYNLVSETSEILHCPKRGYRKKGTMEYGSLSRAFQYIECLCYV